MSTDPAAAEQVRSPDGTSIALWRSGHGRPLVALHGVTIDHSAWDGVRPALEQVETVVAVDRRGHGASGQGPGAHSLDQEVAGYRFDPERFAQLAIPTLVLLGGESPGWRQEAMRALDSALPQSELRILAGQGHLATHTAPELLAGEIIGFLDRGERPVLGGPRGEPGGNSEDG